MNSIVKDVNRKGHYKDLYLDSDCRVLAVAPSACVAVGDLIQEESGRAWVVCKNGLCQIYPIFFTRKTIQFGGNDIEITIKEISEPAELQSVKSLAAYHYRDSSTHGRRSCLVARNFNPLYPKVLGYVELSTPFYMNKARSKILDSRFKYHGISWKNWDKETTRKYINIMVRIARCVIFPEFRGLGIGQILTEAACEFAKSRWQIAGYKPYFIEITADMLTYVPFAEKAGMTYIGETQGNLNRVYKDMEYLTRNNARIKAGEIVATSKVSGIVDQQLTRMNRTLSLLQKAELNREDLFKRLKRLSKEKVLKDYALFYNIVSLPKPTYMKGLNKTAERFLRERSADIERNIGYEVNHIRIDPITHPIILRDLSLSFVSHVRRTRLTHSIQQAFNISPDSIESIVIKGLSLSIQPGEIVLIVGPSGSGKTTLLDYISGSLNKKDILTSGDIVKPYNYKPGVFSPPRSRKPLIEIMQFKYVSSALYIMGLVGLSDAYVYLKRYEELSRGQQYRVRMAKLIASNYNVWLFDEFCANLDLVTANVISDKLQKLARRLGATVIAASPHCGNFISALKPDKVIQLTTAWEHSILNRDDIISNSHTDILLKGSVPSLKVKKGLLSLVREDRKHSTIRAGLLKIAPGYLILETSGDSILVRLKTTTYKKMNELDDKDALVDGFSSASELQDTLLSFYPRLKPKSIVTILEFEHILGINGQNNKVSMF